MLTKALLLGLMLGVRHAIEPDHLAAIGTMIPGERSALAAVRTGALWGLGHAIAIVLFGSALIALGVTVPAKLAFALEILVAVMLIALGLAALRAPKPSMRGRSTVIGFVHGISGTGAIALVCVTTLPSARAAVGFLLLFALGALVSMSAMSGLLSAPLRAIAERGERWLSRLRAASAISAFAAAIFVVAAASGCGSASPPVSAAKPAPEMAEPPYSAAQIRAATKAGRRYEWRLEVTGQPPVRKAITFVKVDDEGCDTRAEGFDEGGNPISPAKESHATWEELRSHALFPKSAVTLGEETVTVPAGTFACVLYTVTDGDEVSRFWFAKDLPGAPVQFSTEKAGKLIMKSTLLKHTPG